jgi:hypothetical protein
VKAQEKFVHRLMIYLGESCRNIICPIAGCLKILPQLSALRFHKIKAHGIIEVNTEVYPFLFLFYFSMKLISLSAICKNKVIVNVELFNFMIWS